jgi:2-oxoglutarate ferredoxin oxidoreductase subunit alpha
VKAEYAMTGRWFMNGDTACAEGALAAGCRFFAGYPITPATEIAEHMAVRMPMVGGIFIQMEDEISSMAAILGAAWGGFRTMTSTSGPGFSLMMENYGLGIVTETPTVVVNVMRGGPSTGLPTLVGQADVMQAKWGTHGDIQAIALCPQSPQELFDLTIRAFNLAERFRTPVIILTDESVGHMTELVTIPKAEDIELVPRRTPTVPPDKWLPYRVGKDLVPEMPRAGQGYRIITTGLTHDERGYPVITSEAQEAMIQRLADKIVKYKDEIVEFEEYLLDDADVVVLAYGISSRPAKRAVRLARDRGIRAGMLRLRTLWPFADKRVRELAPTVKGYVVPEINMGQVALEVERVVAGTCKVRHIGCSGRIHQPEEILVAIEEVNR